MMHALGSLPTFWGVKLANAWICDKKTDHIASFQWGSCLWQGTSGLCCVNQLVQGVRWRELNVACGSLISAAKLGSQKNGSILGSFFLVVTLLIQAGDKTFGRGASRDPRTNERATGLGRSRRVVQGLVADLKKNPTPACMSCGRLKFWALQYACQRAGHWHPRHFTAKQHPISLQHELAALSMIMPEGVRSSYMV